MDKGYEALLNGYKRLFSMVDAIHFNSQNTAEVYKMYIDVPDGSTVIPITHSGIQDCRAPRSYNNSILRLGFVGSEAPYKGLPVLKHVIGKLNADGFLNKLHLDVYGGRCGFDEELCNVEYKGRFGQKKMAEVYSSMDLLVVPSICYETFSLTTIEALQYGVPVLVSNKVGAKDIVKLYAPQFVYDSEEDLYMILQRLIKDRKELNEFNKAVVSSSWNSSMEAHSKEIVRTFY